MKYSEFRAEANEDSSLIDLAAGGGSPANKPSTIICIPDDERTLNLIFAGGNVAGTDPPTNLTFSWKLFAWRDDNAPAEFVGNGTGALGTQDVEIMPNGNAEIGPRSWTDTIVITNDDFVQALSVTTVAQDNVCKLIVKTAGYKYWYIEITNANGLTTEAGFISVWFAVFKDA